MYRVLLSFLFLSFAISSNAQLYLGNYYGEDSEELNGTWNFEIPFGIPFTVKKFQQDKVKIKLAPKYTFSQTYLSDKWIFNTDGNMTSYQLDPDPTHAYKKSIWTHQSKIRSWAWELWAGVETKIGKVTFDAYYAPTYIQTGSFRRKFTSDNEVIKVKERFRDKADFYNINRFQQRVYASFSVYGIGVGGYVNLTPFFKKTQDIDLRKFGITLVIRDNFFAQFFDLDFNEIDLDKNPDVKEMMF